MKIGGGNSMQVEIIVAIIGGVAIVIAAIITAISKRNNSDKSKHGKSISAGRDMIGNDIKQ